MNVCHFLISGGIGGIERQVQSLIEIQRKNYDVGVIFGMHGGVFEVKMKNLEGVSTIILNLKNGMHLSLSATLKAMRFIAKYDIVHIHSFNYIIILAGFLANKKIIFTFHGLTHLRRKLNFRDRIKYSNLSFLSNHVFNELTAVSQFTMEKVRENLNIHKKIEVIPNSTPLIPKDIKRRQIIRKSLCLNEDDLLILSYARLVHNKRMGLLLDAAKVIKNRGLENVKWVIIGDGPEKPSLVEKISIMNFQSDVTLLGFRSNIFDYINASDLCVFPFRQEAFGIVALEAMALGKPVFIMEDGGGLVEVIGPINDSYYVAQDVEDLCDKIYDLACDSEMLSRDKEAFYCRARDFESNSISKCYEILYTHALKNIQ